jgi:hypothetical protein
MIFLMVGWGKERDLFMRWITVLLLFSCSFSWSHTFQGFGFDGPEVLRQNNWRCEELSPAPNDYDSEKLLKLNHLCRFNEAEKKYEYVSVPFDEVAFGEEFQGYKSAIWKNIYNPINQYELVNLSMVVYRPEGLGDVVLEPAVLCIDGVYYAIEPREWDDDLMYPEVLCLEYRMLVFGGLLRSIENLKMRPLDIVSAVGFESFLEINNGRVHLTNFSRSPWRNVVNGTSWLTFSLRKMETETNEITETELVLTPGSHRLKMGTLIYNVGEGDRLAVVNGGGVENLIWSPEVDISVSEKVLDRSSEESTYKLNGFVDNPLLFATNADKWNESFQYKKIEGELDPYRFLRRSPLYSMKIESKENEVLLNIDDHKGRFTFEDLLPGKYTLTLTVPAGNAFGYSEGQEKVVQKQIAIERDSQINLRVFWPLLTIKGRVLDENGNPVANAKVTGAECVKSYVDRYFTGKRITGKLRQGPFIVYSDQDGYYEMPGVKPLGMYRCAGRMGPYLDDTGCDNRYLSIFAQTEEGYFSQNTCWVLMLSQEQYSVINAYDELYIRNITSDLQNHVKKFPVEHAKLMIEDLDQKRLRPRKFTVKGNVISGVDLIMEKKSLEEANTENQQ